MSMPNPEANGPEEPDLRGDTFDIYFSKGQADTTIRPRSPDSPPANGYPRLRLPPREETLRDLPRITFDPNKWTGLACIKEVRVQVATILRCLASGKTVPEILAAYPGLQADDIRQALEYSARQVEIPVIPP